MGLADKIPVSGWLLKYAARFSWAQRLYSLARTRTVTASALLLGRENGLNPNGYAQTMNNLLWTSTPIGESPHVRLLREFQELGDGLFSGGRLEETDYFQYAMRNIDMFGGYYGAKSRDELLGHVRDFAARLLPGSQPPGGRNLSVRRIEGTRCFQIAGDPHSAAIGYARGQRTFRVRVARNQTRTALQELLDRVLWFDGNRELYHPIDAPEIRDSWFLMRKCTDRLGKMREFLGESGLAGRGTSYLDIGSFYGWFVGKMAEAGLDAHGVERDGIAAAVGFACYGIAPSRVHVAEVADWLQKSPMEYDIVSCLSVLHHFVMGAQVCTAETFIQRVARKTRRILFLDTGEEHEGSFGGKLSGWNPDTIEKWVLSHTDFKKAFRLGVDEDARFPHEMDYGRMLFAFVR